MNLIPAFGRDYKSGKAAIEAFARGKDFRLVGPSEDTYANLESFADLPDRTIVQLRFKRLTGVTTVTLGVARALAKTPPPAKAQTFEEWMKQVDRVIAEKCGLSSADLADRDYLSDYDAGLAPAKVAKLALSDL